MQKQRFFFCTMAELFFFFCSVLQTAVLIQKLEVVCILGRKLPEASVLQCIFAWIIVQQESYPCNKILSAVNLVQFDHIKIKRKEKKIAGVGVHVAESSSAAFALRFIT